MDLSDSPPAFSTRSSCLPLHPLYFPAYAFFAHTRFTSTSVHLNRFPLPLEASSLSLSLPVSPALIMALRLFHPPRRRGAFSKICSSPCFLSLTRQRRRGDASLSLLSLRSSLSLRVPLSLSSFLSASSVSGCSRPSRSVPGFASLSAVSSAGCTYTQCVPSSRLQRRGASTTSLRALHESTESARVRRAAAKSCGVFVGCPLSPSSSSSPSRSRGLLSSPVVSGEKHPRFGGVWGEDAARTLRPASGGKLRLNRGGTEMTDSFLLPSSLPSLRDAIASPQASAKEKEQLCTGCASLSRALLFPPRRSPLSVLGRGPASRLFSSSKPPRTEDSTDSLPGVRTPSSSPDLPEEGSEPAGSAVIRRPEKAIRVGAGESLIEAMVEQSLKEAEEKALHARRHQGIELYPGGPVDRYGPPRDPSTLLLESHKLTREERWFQIVFVAAPWFFFLCMLSAPVLLAQYHVKKLGERASLARQVAEELMEASDADFFHLCTFQDLREIVEQPLHAFLCFLHPDTLSSQVVAPLLRDVASLFKRLGIRASVALVDLSAGVPERMQSEFPAALAPHGQLLLPFAFGGQQAAVVDFAELWTAAEIVKAVAAEVPGAQAAMAHTQELDDICEQLSDCLFSLAFVDGDSRASSAASPAFRSSKDDPLAAGSHAAKSGPSSATDKGKQTRERIGGERDALLNPVARVKELNLIGDGGREALQKCRDAREKFRSLGVQQSH
ncbi:UNVERIFIED_CONTAM: hypothetical protein HHA_288710 [Hammondia hammondi]|eukprot:XP_008889060.1 hypothetical protein HHA_288710 [Hammondia hammondi]